MANYHVTLQVTLKSQQLPQSSTVFEIIPVVQQVTVMYSS